MRVYLANLTDIVLAYPDRYVFAHGPICGDVFVSDIISNTVLSVK